jgi:hypothetical protein
MPGRLTFCRTALTISLATADARKNAARVHIKSLTVQATISGIATTGDSASISYIAKFFLVTALHHQA